MSEGRAAESATTRVHPRPPSEITFPESFESFFSREYRQVLALSYVLCGNAWVAEDLTQEAFLVLFRAGGVRNPAGGVRNPSGYVRTVAANLCRSAVRRRLAEARALARLGRRPPPVAPLPEPSEGFWEAVRELPHRQAQVAALFYLEDRSLAEVAAMLGLAEGTVKAHLSRARAALAARLGEDGADS